MSLAAIVGPKDLVRLELGYGSWRPFWAAIEELAERKSGKAPIRIAIFTSMIEFASIRSKTAIIVVVMTAGSHPSHR